MLYWGLDEQARHEHTPDEYKDPNTYSRSTAETIMNPIGQNIPEICLHMETTANRVCNLRDSVLCQGTLTS